MSRSCRIKDLTFAVDEEKKANRIGIVRTKSLGKIAYLLSGIRSQLWLLQCPSHSDYNSVYFRQRWASLRSNSNRLQGDRFRATPRSYSKRRQGSTQSDSKGKPTRSNSVVATLESSKDSRKSIRNFGIFFFDSRSKLASLRRAPFGLGVKEMPDTHSRLFFQFPN